MKTFLNLAIFLIVWGLGYIAVNTAEPLPTYYIMASGWVVAQAGFIIADYISPTR